MYTKTIFIALLFLAINIESKSVENRNINFNTVHVTVAPQAEIIPINNLNNFVPVLLDDVTHHSNEDGKHHTFHFERLTRLRRGRKICCAIGKFIILIMHISLLVLLSGLIHA